MVCSLNIFPGSLKYRHAAGKPRLNSVAEFSNILRLGCVPICVQTDDDAIKRNTPSSGSSLFRLSPVECRIDVSSVLVGSVTQVDILLSRSVEEIKYLTVCHDKAVIGYRRIRSRHVIGIIRLDGCDYNRSGIVFQANSEKKKVRRRRMRNSSR